MNTHFLKIPFLQEILLPHSLQSEDRYVNTQQLLHYHNPFIPILLHTLINQRESTNIR